MHKLLTIDKKKKVAGFQASPEAQVLAGSTSSITIEDVTDLKGLK